MQNGDYIARVLVVDDIPVIYQLLKSQMTKEGYHVTTADGGKEALELIGVHNPDVTETPFDLVILDIIMPDVDGLVVLEEIRKIYPPELLPVIMATGVDTTEDLVDALSLGANDYMVKPLDMPVLLARASTHLKLRQALITLQETQDNLLESAKMESIGRIAAGVAHEVKNPLYVLQMGVDYFSMTADMEVENTAKTVSNMQKAIDRADTILRGMLDFSRRDELTLKPHDINQVIQSTLVLVRHEINTRQLCLDINLAEGLPKIMMDRTKIEQVIINMITNACDAMYDKGCLQIRTAHIGPDCMKENDSSLKARKTKGIEQGVLIEIIDDGTGFPHDYMMKLFDPFYTSKPAGKGTGLGLSVSKTIIDLHHGHIDISNNEAEGARVRIYLNSEGPSSVAEVEKVSPLQTITMRHRLVPKPKKPAQ